VICVGDSEVRRLELAPDFSNVAVARRFVLSEMAGDEAALRDDLQLVVSELVSNAIEHGLRDSVAIEFERTESAVVVRVESTGSSPGVGPVGQWEPARPDEINGRGLAIVRGLADHVTIDRSHDRLQVTVTRSLT
jgi:anti-sigma regulatory factor (Ser/Thr protein kinase)